MISGVPIRGEAGVGYALPRGFDLPPLMFSEEELEALVLGARMVQAWADKRLARAAEEALQKIEEALPDRMKGKLSEAAFLAPDFHVDKGAAAGLDELRLALRQKRKVHFHYVDKTSAPSARLVRPLGVAFWGRTWTLVAWCEKRVGFRSFRLDRMTRLEVKAELFADEAGKTLRDFLEQVGKEPRS